MLSQFREHQGLLDSGFCRTSGLRQRYEKVKLSCRGGDLFYHKFPSAYQATIGSIPKEDIFLDSICVRQSITGNGS